MQSGRRLLFVKNGNTDTDYLSKEASEEREKDETYFEINDGLELRGG